MYIQYSVCNEHYNLPFRFMHINNLLCKLLHLQCCNHNCLCLNYIRDILGMSEKVVFHCHQDIRIYKKKQVKAAWISISEIGVYIFIRDCETDTEMLFGGPQPWPCFPYNKNGDILPPTPCVMLSLNVQIMQPYCPCCQFCLPFQIPSYLPTYLPATSFACLLLPPALPFICM